MQLGKLKCSGLMVRTTLIYFFSGILLNYHLLSEVGLHRVNCLSSITGDALTCSGKFPLELLLWLLIILLIIWELIAKKDFGIFFRKIKLLWPLSPFVLLAFLSTIWSIAPLVTLERSAILVSATIAIVFIVLKRDVKDCLNLLVIYFGLMIAACYLLIFVLPTIGTMSFDPYFGAWRGIFWHRNYLGSFMAFASVIYLFNLLFHENENKVSIILNLLGFASAIGLVLGSRSGAGILTLIMLISLTILIFFWTKFRSRLNKWHYIVIGISFSVAAILLFSNLDFVFGLVGRNTSLTGRIPLWRYLFNDFISDRLFFGHGYGAIWAFQQFRVTLQTHLSWGYPVLIGDNGLIDILLHLGVIGAFLVLLMTVYAFFISIKYASTKKNGMAFLPLISSIFIVMSNISLSMFIELEFFTWFLLIFIFLMCSVAPNRISYQAN